MAKSATLEEPASLAQDLIDRLLPMRMKSATDDDNPTRAPAGELAERENPLPTCKNWRRENDEPKLRKLSTEAPLPNRVALRTLRELPVSDQVITESFNRLPTYISP
jgi:hypothetical protein